MKFYVRLFFARNLEKLITLAEEYVFHGDLEKIIEVTYSYRDLWDWNLLNETLFEEYLDLTYPEYDIVYLARRYKYKVSVQIVIIDDILKKIKTLPVLSRSESLKRGIFTDALEYVKNILEISVLWTSFEMEKAWYTTWLNQTQTKRIMKQIGEKERLVFWKKVIEVPCEFSFCYNFIVKNHKTKQHLLSENDRKMMWKYLKRIKETSPCELVETPDIQTKYIKGAFMKKTMDRKDYRKIFDSVCDLYGLPQKTKITNAGSIYDGDNFLEIPRNDGFKCFHIERLLKLLTHEIESHYINSYNGKKLLWKFRWAKNLPKEEWLAMFMEKIFHWYTYDNINNIVEYFFTIIAWECLDGERFEDFMRIMWKEYKCKRDYRASVIRAKRNYSIEHIWVQHKDVVYFRGLTKVLDYLKGGWDFRKLFLWKVGFQDIENIETIYQAYPNKDELVFPIFISDLVYYYFNGKLTEDDFEFKTPEYYLYLKKKYWFIDIESFKIIEHINRDWKKIERILKMFEKVIFD